MAATSADFEARVALSRTSLCTIQAKQYWTLDDKGSITTTDKPNFICVLSQVKQLAAILAEVNSTRMLDGSFANEQELKEALTNVSTRTHHLTDKMNFFAKIISDVFLWIIGYRGENSFSAMAGRVDDRLKAIQRKNAIANAHKLASSPVDRLNSLAPSALTPALVMLRDLPYQKDTLIAMPVNLSSLAKAFKFEDAQLEKNIKASKEGYKDSTGDKLIKKYDKTLKIGYGLCLEVLSKAPDFLKELEDKKGDKRSASDLLRKTDTYYPNVLSEFARVYKGYVALEHGEAFFAKKTTEDSTAHRNRILTDKTTYKEGTPQYQWREMFLDVCAEAKKLDPTFDLTV